MSGQSTAEHERRRPLVRRLVLLVVVLGLLLVGGTLVLDFSQAARRLTGSDRIKPDVYSAVVPGGGTACQPLGPLPPGTGAAQMLIGTYYRPLPHLRLRFLDPHGVVVAQGALAGGSQGYVTFPLRVRGALRSVARACLHVGGVHRVALAGIVAPIAPAAEVIDGRTAPADFTMFYLRGRPQTWWQLLPTLDRRFAYGKSPFFGRWTLPAVALLVAVLWIGSARLVIRELR